MAIVSIERNEVIEQLILLLKSLKNAKYTPRSEYLKTVCLVDDVLICIFEIEIAKTELSPSDRNIIGPLIAESLKAFGSWVSDSVDEIHEGTKEIYKIERSGLEFLLERYQDLPDGSGGSLEHAFKEFNVTEDVEDWDKKFKNVNSSFDTNFFYKISEEPTLTPQEMEQVPTSHWWWW